MKASFRQFTARRGVRTVMKIVMAVLMLYPLFELSLQGFCLGGDNVFGMVLTLCAMLAGSLLGLVTRKMPTPWAVLTLVSITVAAFLAAFFPWAGIHLKTIWMIGAAAAAAAGFLLARMEIPSVLDARLIPVGIGLYLASGLLLGWIFPMPGAGDRLAIFGALYVVAAVLIINNLSVHEAAQGNVSRSVRWGGRIMLIPIVILGLLLMNGPMVSRALQGILWVIAQVVGAFVAALGWLLSLFAQSTPEGLRPAEKAAMDLEPGVDTPLWMQILMWVAAAAIVAFVLFIAVRGAYRALKRLIERTSPQGRFIDGEGYVDVEEEIVQIKKQGWFSQMLHRFRRKNWRDCEGDRERVRLAYRRVLEHLEEQEDANPLIRLTPTELAGQAHLRRISPEELEILAQGYNLARYSQEEPAGEQVETARKVYSHL